MERKKDILNDLPTELAHEVLKKMNLEDIKSLRLVNKDTKGVVDSYVSTKNFGETKQLELGAGFGLEWSRAYLAYLPPFSHSELSLDFPSEDLTLSFYTQNLSEYFVRFGKHILSLKINKFLALTDHSERNFFNQFPNLQKIKLYNVSDVQHASPIEIPSSFLNITTFDTVWSSTLLSLGWFTQERFLPKRLKFREILPQNGVEFISEISQHMKNRVRTIGKPLEYLKIDEDFFDETNDVPLDLLGVFTRMIVENDCIIKGVTENFLSRLEGCVDRKTFRAFLRLMKSSSGIHPLMKEISMDNLSEMRVCKSSFQTTDQRWTSGSKNNRALKKLEKIDIKIQIQEFTESLPKNMEKIVVERIIDTVLNSESTRLESLKLSIIMPDWYPLDNNILSNYVLSNHWPNLKYVEITAILLGTEVFRVLHGLSFCKVKKLALRNCLLTDESFIQNGLNPLIDFDGLELLFLYANNPCTKAFLTDITISKVLSKLPLRSFHMEGSFPLITEAGIRSFLYEEEFSTEIHDFNFEDFTLLDLGPDDDLHKINKAAAVSQVKAKSIRNRQNFDNLP